MFKSVYLLILVMSVTGCDGRKSDAKIISDRQALQIDFKECFTKDTKSYLCKLAKQDKQQMAEIILLGLSDQEALGKLILNSQYKTQLLSAVQDDIYANNLDKHQLRVAMAYLVLKRLTSIG